MAPSMTDGTSCVETRRIRYVSSVRREDLKLDIVAIPRPLSGWSCLESVGDGRGMLDVGGGCNHSCSFVRGHAVHATRLHALETKSMVLELSTCTAS